MENAQEVVRLLVMSMSYPGRQGGPDRDLPPNTPARCHLARAASLVGYIALCALSYPRQAMYTLCVQWPSRARDACAKTPVARRDFPPSLRAPLMAFSSMALVHLGTNDWR